jgi:hypothetical protein
MKGEEDCRGTNRNQWKEDAFYVPTVEDFYLPKVSQVYIHPAFSVGNISALGRVLTLAHDDLRVTIQI